jgi:hypothetical protein
VSLPKDLTNTNRNEVLNGNTVSERTSEDNIRIRSLILCLVQFIAPSCSCILLFVLSCGHVMCLYIPVYDDGQCDILLQVDPYYPEC